MHGVDEVPETAAKPIEFPHHQGVTLPQGFERGIETGPGVEFARSVILVDVAWFDTGRGESVALEVR